MHDISRWGARRAGVRSRVRNVTASVAADEYRDPLEPRDDGLGDAAARAAGADRPADQQGHRLHPARARRARARRPAAAARADHGPAGQPGLPPVPRPAHRPGEEHVPDGAARPQRGAVLPPARRPPARDAARSSTRRRSARRSSATATSTAAPRRLPLGRGPRRGRARPARRAAADPTTSTSSSRPTPRASWASATGASAASRSRSGKLNVYTAAAGINPSRTLAVMLDVGTNRQELLDDPLYLGVSPPAGATARSTTTSSTATSPRRRRLFPHALLHWEDFGTSNARRILQRYRSTTLTFNDDMQGTGAVNLAAVLSASAVSGRPLRRAPGRGLRLGHRRASASPTSCATRWRRWAAARRGDPAVLVRRTPRAARRRPGRPARLPGALRPTGREVAGWARDDRARRHQPGRGGPPGASHHPDRHLGAAARLHRGARPRDGRPRRATDHHADVEPDGPRRGGARPTCSPGPTAGRSWRPGARSRR